MSVNIYDDTQGTLTRVDGGTEKETVPFTSLKGTLEAGGITKVGPLYVINARVRTTEAINVGSQLATVPFDQGSSACVAYNCENYELDGYSNIIRAQSSIPNNTVVIFSAVIAV